MTLLILKFPTMKALLLIITVILTVNLEAQNLIAVQNGDTPEFFYALDSAIIHAQNGDTIYLPGGNFTLSNYIDKNLHIIGTGHHPDSTSSTFSTTIGQFLLADGASNGSLSGVNINGSIQCSQAVHDYKISRCKILNQISLFDSSYNFIFIENIFMNCFVANSQFITNCSFYNNIFTYGFCWSSIAYKNCVFKNNIFLNGQGYGYLALLCQYSIIDNNIFLGVSSLNGISNSTLRNNLFKFDVAFQSNANSDLSNIINYPGEIFINQSGGLFNYSHNYHLAPECTGNNAGTDGTDIGIYGGIFPWKEGSIPRNPHIKTKSISGATDPNGNINVTIRVAAQDN